MANAAHDMLEARIRNFLHEHPMRAATQQQASIHEAGHLIAFELEGMCAERAEVSGTPFGHDGWSGIAWASLPPQIYSSTTGHDLLRDARSALAGPIAEELLAEGNVFGSIGELIDARVLMNLAARRLELEPNELAHDAVLTTIAIVQLNAPTIRQIAERLARVRRVARKQIINPLEALTRNVGLYEFSECELRVAHRIERVFGFGPLRKIAR